MFCWDVNKHEVISKLECANIIPAVDSHKIHRMQRFEGENVNEHDIVSSLEYASIIPAVDSHRGFKVRMLISIGL